MDAGRLQIIDGVVSVESDHYRQFDGQGLVKAEPKVGAIRSAAPCGMECTWTAQESALVPKGIER